MMPGDSDMTSIVQRIARQALVTYRSPPRLGEEAGKTFLENHAKLRSLMTEVRAADLKLAPRRAADSPHGAPPLHPGAPRSHTCTSDPLLRPLQRPAGGPQVAPPLPPAQMASLGAPCCAPPGVHGGERPVRPLPDRDNLHQIDAVDGPTAFMDILAPPYDPDDGRDCHYYKVLTEAEVKHTEQKEQEVWLMEVSQPPDFWCGGEPYPGPEVCL
ncbi:2-aminoethanethiol dioxygenase [Larimichthys crocea]|uniref:2-aminoethanethiol dioxygenase n=1 Tax=Larimichthys crocea TaxID=215358 RepID=A0A6G0HNW6_LARCR|nr:2-aminoethanethiol dioxygenase [Larimichthys crocea]